MKGQSKIALESDGIVALVLKIIDKSYPICWIVDLKNLQNNGDKTS